MNLDSVADELYGLPLDDFVPTRTARERQAKDTHDKELAAEIHGLPKPNIVAWLINQLVRKHNDEILVLLALGSSMREATVTLSGDRLRELSREQRSLIRGLLHQAEQLANESGRHVSADTFRRLEETLYATLADPGTADTVAAGRLFVGLNATGFAALGSAAAQQMPSVTKRPSRAKDRPRTGEPQGVEQRERVEARVAEARSVAETASQARDDAYTGMQEAEQSVADASERVEQVRRELQQAVKTQSKTEREYRRAHSALDRADRRATDAQQRLADEVARREPEAR